MFVTKYRVTRHYGGPEEGGWWYDRHQVVEAITTEPDAVQARFTASMLNEQAKAERRQPSGNYQGRYSVANHTDEVYLAELNYGENDDSEVPRPRYE